MPVGGGGKGKPAGGYRAGKKGSYGCKGYPTVSADGTVHGCHPTKAKASAQARAIWASTSAKKFDSISKAIPVAGDFVMFNDDDEISVGRIEYIMDQPGTLGLEGSEYAVDYSEDDKPAIVRYYEEDDGVWEETKKLIYVKLSEVVKIDSLMVSTDVIMEMSAKPESLFKDFGKDYTRVDRLIELGKRERSMATRERLAATGAAMPDGSYPIVTVEDLRNAIQAFGRTDNPQATKEHIMRRARALGRTDLIPENWK